MKASLPFAPPQFHDEAHARLAMLVYKILVPWMIIILAYGFTFIFVAPANTERWIIMMTVLFGATVVSLVLNRRGMSRLASLLFVVQLWMIISAFTLTGGGIAGQGVPLYLLVILIAGVLLGARTGLATTIVCVFTELLFVYMEKRGLLPESSVHPTPLTLWLSQLLAASLLYTVLYLSQRGLNEALDRSKRELTHRVEAEDKVRISEEKFSKAFRSSPIAIAVTNLTSGKFVEVNEAMVKFLGYTREELVGRTTLDLGIWINVEDRRHLFETLTDVGSVHNQEFRFRTKQGAEVISQYSAECMEIGGEQCILSVLSDITDRKRTENDLLKSEEKFSKAFRSSPTAMVINRLNDNKFIEVNSAYERLSGYKRDEVIGNTALELGTWIDPKDRERFINLFASRGHVHDFVTDSRTKDGQVNTRSISAELIELGGEPCRLTVIVDLTERRRAEEALRSSEALYHTLVDNTPDIVAVFDREIRYLFVNASVAQVSAITPADFVGRRLSEVGFNEEQARLREETIRRVFETAVPLEAEFEFNGRSGKAVFDWRVYPILDAAKNVRSVYSISRNITERKRAEDALKVSMEQLQALTMRLERIREEERKSISREVHDELGQILTALKMDLMSLKKMGLTTASVLSEKLQSMLDLTANAIKSVQDISAKLRPGMLDDLGLVAAIEWQIEDFQKRSGISCTVNLPGREPGIDGQRSTALFRILQETLTNVARHARAKNVWLTLSDSGGEISLSVRDDGIGIAAGEIDNPKSYGLLGIRERLRPFGGACVIRRGPKGGTEVSIRLQKQPREAAPV